MDGKHSNLQLRVNICILSAMLLLTSHEAHAHRWKKQVAASSMGTTEDISEIFQGRCHEHLQCLQTDQCNTRPKVTNCTAIWIEFLAAFQYKDPCFTPEDTYDQVLSVALPVTPNDQTLFWSGLLDAALNVARVSMQYRILEESLPGYLANNLVWCGDSDSEDGINYDKCPTSFDCKNETTYLFWQAASREFSKQAKGKVSVALNAHRDGGAFRNTSVFATVELPNLNPNVVTMVEVLLIPNITAANKPERCGEGSIKELQRRLDKAGLKHNCSYDPVEFRLIQCTTLKNPLDYEECKNDKGYSEEFVIIIGTVLGALTLVLSITVIILIAVVVNMDKGRSSQQMAQL